MFVRKLMPKEYQNNEKSGNHMPVAATFISTLDSPGLKVIIKAMEEKPDATGKRMVSVMDSAVRVEFRGGVFRTNNALMVRSLMEHKGFGKSTRGFNIDLRDDTGFWRELGYVEVEMVATAVPVASGKKIGKPTVATMKKMSGALVEKLEKEDEDGTTIVVEPLVVDSARR